MVYRVYRYTLKGLLYRVHLGNKILEPPFPKRQASSQQALALLKAAQSKDIVAVTAHPELNFLALALSGKKAAYVPKHKKCVHLLGNSKTPEKDVDVIFEVEIL